jgi:hypothetical protein
MKNSLKLIGMVALVLTACSPKDETPLTAIPAPPAPSAALDVTGGVQSLPPAMMPVAPPPNATAATPPAEAQAAAGGSAVDKGTEHMTDVQRLTYALQLFYGDSSAPAITDFQPLVERRILARVPTAPAGKKYIIDLSKLEVRLENL